jgi:hypothetical protein
MVLLDLFVLIAKLGLNGRSTVSPNAFWRDDRWYKTVGTVMCFRSVSFGRYLSLPGTFGWDTTVMLCLFDRYVVMMCTRMRRMYVVVFTHQVLVL